MIVYGLKNCDSCKKATRALDAAGIAFDFRDVRADGVTKTQIAEWAKAAGWESLLNTRSTTWRGLDDADKAGVDERKAVALMAAYPTLIKRPVIENGGDIYVGWTKAAQQGLIG